MQQFTILTGIIATHIVQYVEYGDVECLDIPGTEIPNRDGYVWFLPSRHLELEAGGFVDTEEVTLVLVREQSDYDTLVASGLLHAVQDRMPDYIDFPIATGGTGSPITMPKGDKCDLLKKPEPV